MSETKQSYISHVHLKGSYKSILDVEIDLKPGLNILIGENGSGKTNFLEYLWKTSGGNWEMQKIQKTFENEITLIT